MLRRVAAGARDLSREPGESFVDWTLDYSLTRGGRQRIDGSWQRQDCRVEIPLLMRTRKVLALKVKRNIHQHNHDRDFDQRSDHCCKRRSGVYAEH